MKNEEREAANNDGVLLPVSEPMITFRSNNSDEPVTEDDGTLIADSEPMASFKCSPPKND